VCVCVREREREPLLCDTIDTRDTHLHLGAV